MRKVAHMLKRRLHNMLTCCRLGITNAVDEGINSKLMAINRRACGYRNPEHFKTAAYFFLRRPRFLPRLNPGGPCFKVQAWMAARLIFAISVDRRDQAPRAASSFSARPPSDERSKPPPPAGA